MKPNLYSLPTALLAVVPSRRVGQPARLQTNSRHASRFEATAAHARDASPLPRIRPLLTLALLALGVGGTSSALSQTVDDGFNPNANNSVYALAVQTNGQIIIGGSFSTVGGASRNCLARLNLDGTLDTSFTNVANTTVWKLVRQPADGKILVGGDFTMLGGQPRTRLARLNADGTLDNAFNPGANNTVWTFAVQADGKILVGGNFTMLGGTNRNYVARLNADGTLDNTFNPGANNLVRSLAVQADGKILVGGYFTTLGGQTRNHIARLNPDGTLDDAFNPGANGSHVWSLAVQADGNILAGGLFTTLGGQTRTNLARLHADGTLDSTFVLGANSVVYSLTVQPDGKILVGGDFTALAGQPRVRVGRLNPDGSLDSSFDPTASPYYVYAVALQVDGKILAGGAFTSLGGQTRNRIARLYPDGSLDASLNPAASTNVLALAVQPDGKIVAGGAFTTLGGQTRNRIARLYPSGSLDTSFNPGANNAVYAVAVLSDGKILAGGAFTSPGGHLARLEASGAVDGSFTLAANGDVYSFAVQTNGQILVGGNFTMLGGQPRTNLARLTVGGALDLTFNPGASGPVYSLAVQADGRILVGGDFTMLAGQARTNIGRLEASGTVDAAFNPGANLPVYSLVVQPDGKILVGGNFTMLAGQTRYYLARLDSAGSLDGTFTDPVTVGGAVYSLALQTDGKIIAGGDFTQFGAVTYDRIARLESNGTVDSSFNPGANSTVYAVAVQADGKILVGGAFTSLGGQTRNHIGRLTDGSLVPQTLALDSTATMVTWSRSGGGPELQQVTFEQSPTGTNYNLLGNGTRISGGWQYSGLSQSPGVPFYIRARGRTLGARYAGSSGLIEATRQFIILKTNANLTSLVPDEGTLSPAFAPNTANYSATVSNQVGYLTVTPTRADDKAWIQVRVNGGPYQLVPSGMNSGALLLNTGTNLIEVLVTAQDLVTLKTYSIAVTRLLPPTPWLGPFYPPRVGDPDPLTVVSASGSIGRAGGMHWLFSNVQVANDYPTHWGATNDGVRLSFNDNVYTNDEVLTYQPALSSLAEGIAVWSGQTTLPSSATTVYTRFTLSVSNYYDGTAIPLTEATNLGLPANIGGLVRVNPGLQYEAVLRFQASLNVDGPFEPALDFYDSHTPSPAYDNGAHSSFAGGFYILNRPPVLTMNSQLMLDRGATGLIPASLLAATDADTPADRIRFNVAPEGGGPPTRNGDLFLNGTNLITVQGSFSQTDINLGRVSYVHNNNCETNDDFTFIVTDDAGGIASDGGFTVFTFHISIVQPNLHPEAFDGSFATGLQAPYQGFLPGTNQDCVPQTLTFSIVDLPGKGDVVLDDPNTGAFTYTPKTNGTGLDSFTFQVYDGEYYAANPGTMTISISNMPPVADAGSGITHENVAYNGTLSATDPDLPPQALTFIIVTNGVRGTAVVTDAVTGAFTYTPLAGAIGEDSFSFKVSDPLMLTSAPAPFSMTIRPDLEVGDLLVTEPGRVVLVDPSGAQAEIASGGLLNSPRGVAVDNAGQVLVMDPVNGLIRIDPTSGAQTPVSPSTNFSIGPIGPWGLAVEAAGTILVADGTNGVVRVDPLTGMPTVLAAGEPLPLPFSVTVAPDGEIWVGDADGFLGGNSRIVRVDRMTGTPTMVSSNANLKLATGLVLENSGALLVADGGPLLTNIYPGLVLRIEPTNGNQTVLSATNLLLAPIGLALGTNGMIYVANLGGGTIVQVDPVSGAQSLFASGFTQLFGIAVVREAPVLLVFTGYSVVAPGQFQLKALGQEGLTYTLQTSTNLVNWMNHTNLVAGPGGLIEFSEPLQLAAPAYFYRLRWP